MIIGVEILFVMNWGSWVVILFLWFIKVVMLLFVVLMIGWFNLRVCICVICKCWVGLCEWLNYVLLFMVMIMLVFLNIFVIIWWGNVILK